MKTILITGCSSGFGAAAARYFASHGWNVVATMRDTAKADDLASHDKILVTHLDVENRSSINAAIDAGIARFGRIDAIVNNAGYGLFAIFEGTSREAIKHQFNVNLFGVMDVTRAILPHFRTNKAGVIVNVSSGAGVFGAPMATIYSASKFALEGFSEALSYEVRGLGIKVKIIEPGGAPATGFMSRASAESAAVSIDAEYQPFMKNIAQVYGLMTGSADHDAVEKVTVAIFQAVTDGADRLRYAPTDDIQPLLAARRSRSEDEYQALVRHLFANQLA